MKPIIGVTSSITADALILQMNRSYPESIAQAGGAALLLPATEDADTIARYADMLDGLLLTGGDDVDPALYGEFQRWDCGDISPLRDAFEMAVCSAFIAREKPILGICRGIQLLNVALGGTLHQDLAHEIPNSIAHRQKQPSCHPSHPVMLSEDSLLRDMFGEKLLVNSHHHQAVRDPGQGLRITATAPDGVVEAVEHATLPFCVGVQWHPERMWRQRGGEDQLKLFRAFVQACAK
ncbi:MAG: gamma-glutamyl-gamma-aminobutyrate hydrolase family protein [Clostridia bacterium]|nr:gamma-glutamyl-gamma-aminobutyrate hydrolase family protein [Clostridia bacterium]